MKLIPRKNKQKATGGETHLPEVYSKLRSEMDGLFDRFLRAPWDLPLDFFGPANKWTPAVEVIDGAKEVTVKAEVPGVDPKELEISISGNVLTISGEKKEAKEEKGDGFYRSERCFGSFRRSLELPSTANTEKVAADYSKGVLTVRVEKAESAKPRKIAIRS
jgi:HSP20 family protein